MGLREKTLLVLPGGNTVEAARPLIISASRATDIPSVYTPWFLNSLERGWVVTTNPFNGTKSYVSFSETRVFVFWTKNPAPLMPFLERLDSMGYGYYFLFTLNDYEAEGIEPHLPTLDERIATFIELARMIGREKVLWRFDPLLLSHTITPNGLLQKIEHIGESIHRHTNKLIFSFVDINKYKKVQQSIARHASGVREFSLEEKMHVASRLSELRDRWKYNNPLFAVASCAQDIDLGSFGIEHNRCIDAELLAELFPNDERVMRSLKLDMFGKPDLRAIRHKGQRTHCGCMESKDIGSYNTCIHHCAYCYANGTRQLVMKNHGGHNPRSESIL